MGQLLLAVDPDVGVEPGRLAAVWDADAEASALGRAVLRRSEPGVFLPGLVELVVVPLAVSLTSSVLYDLVRGLLRRCRPGRSDVADLELVESTTGQGDRLLVVRVRRERV